MTKLSVFPLRLGGLGLLLAAALAIGTARLGAIPAAPVMNAATVVGPNVTLSWAAVAGATSYRLAAGLAPGATIFSQNLGNTTSIGVAAANGTYYVRVFAIDATGESPASNEVTVQVVSQFVPPSAPTDLAAYINGTSALITWARGSGGGSPTAFVLYAGSSPGASDVGVFPVSAAGTQLTVGNVAPRTYYLRIAAVNQGGSSAVSNEATLAMPAGGGCSAPPARTFTTSAFGTYVQFSWTPVPGANQHRLDFSTAAGGPVTLRQAFGPSVGRWSVPGAPLGTFYGKLVTSFSCGSESAGPEVAFTIDGAPPPGPRSPNPAPGQRLPFRAQDGAVIEQLARERPDLLRSSCHETGGNNRFMFEAVRRLRAIDNRYGLNWKRGNAGDLSQDIVNYNPTDQPDEGNRNPYIIDIIGGHCGPNPSAAWIDQTVPTRNAGTIGIWTLIPYLDAGYPIVSDQDQQ